MENTTLDERFYARAFVSRDNESWTRL